MENKTKEEILENGTKSYVPAIHCIKQYKQGNCEIDSVETCIKSAMDEYARTQAIGFAEWTEDNYWYKYYNLDRWVKKIGDSISQKISPVTTSELYDLYLKTLEK